jgi:ubiquinone/menaquinone biosynthesis C-methylase UbiE
VHLEKPEEALLEWRRIVKPGGAITIYVPCEPGILLKIFRNTFTKPKAKKLGFNCYDLFIARDHKSSADRVLNICRFVFRHDSLKFGFYPFRLRSWNLNLFIIVQVEKK